MQPRTLPIVLGGSWQNDWAATSVSSQSIWLMEVVKDNDWYLLSSLWWTFHVELQSLYTLPSNWFTLIKLPRYRTVFRIWRQQMTEDSFYKIAFYNRNVVCLIVSRLSLAPQITRWAAGRVKVEKVLSLVWDVGGLVMYEMLLLLLLQATTNTCSTNWCSAGSCGLSLHAGSRAHRVVGDFPYSLILYFV